MSAGRNFIAPEAKAAMGLALLKEANLSISTGAQGGVRNHELAVELGLESSHEGRQQHYLTYSVLGILMKDASVRKIRRSGKVYYVSSANAFGPGP
jgi:uncharacterized protein